MKRLVWLGLVPAALFVYYQLTAPNGTPAHLMHYVVQFAFLAFAAQSLAAAVFANRDRKLRSFWASLAFGSAIWAFTSLLEMLELLLGEPTYGTVADGFWLAGYLPLLFALFTGTRILSSWKNRSAVFFAAAWLAVAACVIVVIVTSAMPPVNSELVLVLGWIYHLMDVGFVALAVLCVMGESPQLSKKSTRLILAAAVLFYGFNLLVILQQLTSPLDAWAPLGFSGGYYCLYLAGHVQEKSL